MKTILLGGTPFRVVRRTRTAITLIPSDTSNPRILLLSRSVADPSRADWRDQWGRTVDDRVTWYRQISPDTFEKI